MFISNNYAFSIINKRLSSAGFSRWLHLGKRLFTAFQRDWVLDDVIGHLQSSSTCNVVVMAGAGISTPSGIPDFRTPGTGLYDDLQKYDLPYAEAIFDLDYFRKNPKPFFALAKELYPGGRFAPNEAHHFCRLLHDKGKLLRMFTQNIDGLERLAGMSTEKLVEAHGTLSTARCTVCRMAHDGPDVRRKIMDDQIPKCDNGNCPGIVKPDIVFFGEQLPDAFHRNVGDLPKADTLIVMGSSLQVQPFASLSDMVGDDVPRILLNSEPVSSFVCSDRPRDVLILGDIVDNVRSLTTKLGWNSELEALVKKKS